MKLGAVGIGAGGKTHPTSAGMLRLGNEYDITREFNTYLLDYQEQYSADTRWTDYIISCSCDSRIEIDVAKSGGVSDSRNATMMLNMINLIYIGECAGIGIQIIYRVWRKQGWKEPITFEPFEPNRIVLSLVF